MYTVYKITCLINGKRYFGCTSKSIKERWKQHLWTVNSHPTRPLYSDILQYGVNNFIIEAIKSFKSDIYAYRRERFYISKHNTLIQNGYNRPVGKAKLNPILNTNY